MTPGPQPLSKLKRQLERVARHIPIGGLRQSRRIEGQLSDGRESRCFGEVLLLIEQGLGAEQFDLRGALRPLVLFQKDAERGPFKFRCIPFGPAGTGAAITIEIGQYINDAIKAARDAAGEAPVGSQGVIDKVLRVGSGTLVLILHAGTPPKPEADARATLERHRTTAVISIDLTRGEWTAGLPAAAEPPSTPPSPPSPPSPGGTMMKTFMGPKAQQYADWSQWHQAHPPRHWKAGRSAMLLAQSWGLSDALPWRVKLALEREQRFQGLDFKEAEVEFKSQPPGSGYPSATDLMVWASNTVGPVAVAVEGKVTEDFGPLVAEWRTQSKGTSGKNRDDRVDAMGATLGLAPATLDPLRYQLVHRIWSALEAARLKEWPTAVMLVHSFLPASHPENHFDDFEAFAAALGVQGVGPDKPLHVGMRGAVDLWLCWVSDAGGVP